MLDFTDNNDDDDADGVVVQAGDVTVSGFEMWLEESHRSHPWNLDTLRSSYCTYHQQRAGR